MKNEDKDKLPYFSDDQRIYLRLLNRYLPDHDGDMARTIIYLQTHQYFIENFEHEAIRRLTVEEKNHVISELLLPF